MSFPNFPQNSGKLSSQVSFNLEESRESTSCMEIISNRLKTAYEYYQVRRATIRLFHAIDNDNTDEAIQIIASRVFKPNHVYAETTALYKAIEKGSLPVIERLVDAHANVNQFVGNSPPPLEKAFLKQQPQITNFLLTCDEIDFTLIDTVIKTELFHQALNEKNIDIAIKLIQNGADVNEEVNDTFPLLIAINKENLDLLNALIARSDLEINKTNNEGETAIYQASEKNQVDIVKELLNSGADVNIHNKHGITPLIAAAAKGNCETVELLLGHPDTDVDLRSRHGDKAIHWAAYLGHLEVVQIFANYGVDIHSPGWQCKTPIEQALHNNHHKVFWYLLDRIDFCAISTSIKAELLHKALSSEKVDTAIKLIQNGADVNKQNNGDTPLLIAAKKGYCDIVELLLTHPKVNLDSKGPLNKAILLAASKGHFQVMQMLLKHGADINVSNWSKKTPLELSWENKHYEVVRQLLDSIYVHSISIAVKTRLLHKALNNNKIDIAIKLIQSGADVNETLENSILVPLLKAIDLRNLDLVKALTNRPDLEINKRKNFSETALYLASLKGLPTIVNELLKHQVDVNIQDQNGYTSLMAAVWKGNSAIVEMLLAHPDINVDLETRQHDKVIHWAAWSGNLESVQRIVNYGADINSPGWSNKTPLEQALDKNHCNICWYLLDQIDFRDISAATKARLLNRAIEARKIDTAIMLIQNGADINENFEDSRDLFPLLAAVVLGDLNLVKALTARPDLEINKRNSLGEAALFHASSNGLASIVDELLHSGADVNIQDNNRNSPLMTAAGNGHCDVVESLLAHPDINVDLETRQHDKAIHWVAWAGHLDVLKMFVKYGVDFNAPGWKGRTPIEQALHNNSLEVVWYLLNLNNDIPRKEFANLLLEKINRLDLVDEILMNIFLKIFFGTTKANKEALKKAFESLAKKTPLESAKFQFIRKCLDDGDDKVTYESVDKALNQVHFSIPQEITREISKFSGILF